MLRRESQYRESLETLKQQSQESYDKTVLSLSAGALGVSFAFVKDIVGSWPAQKPSWLFIAWVCWGLSVTAVLFSFLCSQKALRKAIKQVDNGEIDRIKLGGVLNQVTIILNSTAGIAFLLGVISMIIFISYNMKG